MPGNSLIRQSDTLLLPGMAGWHLGLLFIYIVLFPCFLLCTTFTCDNRLQLRLLVMYFLSLSCFFLCTTFMCDKKWHLGRIIFYFLFISYFLLRPALRFDKRWYLGLLIMHFLFISYFLLPPNPLPDKRWQLGLLIMHFFFISCFLLHISFISDNNLGARFQLCLPLHAVQPLPLRACIRWSSLAIRWLLLHGMLAFQATSWTSGEQSGLKSTPQGITAYETNLENKMGREILIGKEIESSCWTRLPTWSKSVKGTAAIRKLRISQTSIFQLFDHNAFATNTLGVDFRIKRRTQNDLKHHHNFNKRKTQNELKPHHNFNPVVRNPQRQLGPLTDLKMESQIQDDLLSEWSLEATPGFEFDTQLQLQLGSIPFNYYTQPVATGLIQADVQHNLPGVFQDPLVFASSVTDMFHDPIVPGSGFFMQEMAYHEPTWHSINPGASTTDFRTTSSSLSSCSSSDSYNFRFRSPAALGGNEYGVSETIPASFPSTDLTVAPVMQDNDFITASTSLIQHVIPLAEQSRQIEGTTTAASPQQPPKRIQQSQPPLTQTEKPNEIPATPPRSRTGRPRNPMREWRMKHRPEKCSECGEGFPFKSELKRHITTRHPDEATPKYGLSTERFFCKLCPRSYKRRERLKRHEREKHSQSITRRVSQSQAPESDQKPPALGEGRPALKRLCPRGSCYDATMMD